MNDRLLPVPFSIDHLDMEPRPQSAKLDDSEALEVVTRTPKQTIESADTVPVGKITWFDVHTLMSRPRTLDRDYPDHPWHHQLTKAYVLHLSDGFIGDNVIFDRDGYYSLGKWWLGSTWEHYRNIHRVQRVSGMVMSIAAWGGEAFQHFIMDVMPRLSAVIDLLESPGYREIQIASHLRDCAIASWLWQRLGLQDRIVQKPINANEGFVIAADVALYPDFYPGHAVAGFYPRHSLQSIQKRLGLLEPVAADRVLYLQRAGARSVANEEQVLSTLRRSLGGSGYALDIFHPSGDFDRDLAVMSRAKLVLGPHGGAFANLAFASPGTHVIEFLPSYALIDNVHTAGRNYWGLAQAAGLDYWSLVPTEFSFDGPMSIDCQRLRQTVESVLCATQPVFCR